MMMSKTLVAVLAIGLTCSAAAAGAMPERIVQAARDRVAAGQYPALVIATVDNGQTTIEAFGTLPGGKAPDGDTVFEIGSVTKTFTATLLAEAVNGGRATLDEPVAKLLPDFTIPSRNGKQITLGNLSDQHSGLPRLPDNMQPADPNNPYADYDSVALRMFLGKYTLPRDPDSAYEYSNLGQGLLGYALATAARTDYGSLVRKDVFAPLGMTLSGVAIDDAMRVHLAAGHDGDGKLAKNWDFDTLAGCGAIKSTANDMVRYLRANMGVDKTALYPAMQLAHTPRADMDKVDRVGLAWITRTTPTSTVVWHNGMTGGYASFLGFTADGKHGVVVLTNIMASVDDLGFAALDAAEPLAPARKFVTMTPQELAPYQGAYKLTDAMTIRVIPVGPQLYIQATGQGPIAIYPTAPNSFFTKIGDIGIGFTRDPKGKVTALVLHQKGDHTAPRVPEAPHVTLPPDVLAQYAGHYELAPGHVFTATVEDGQLMMQLTGQPAFPVLASAKDHFFFTVADAKVDFERDANGAVIALVLHQNGRDLRAPRVP
jgi:CubicO group peptidase (beta-lactamase class C family)